MSSLVSVIIPVYNVEKYLRKCLDSICNQTYRNLEILRAKAIMAYPVYHF
ncbi:MAG: glycosyltransferase family 2 protein [Akkermansia sp.]|nr:glycosyltransferase family 2 protein [Akkermansia sp.]MBR6576739.1 glycosyltransferase family 2 protein [Akkermansia sp.]